MKDDIALSIESFILESLDTTTNLENTNKYLLSNSSLLYIHIPFCKQICPYCDFNVYKTSTFAKKKSPYTKNIIETYVENICLEIKYWVKQFFIQQKTFQTIYFGGGTPSQLNVNQLETILNTIRNNLNLSNNIEITIEANPLDITAEYAKSLNLLGFNRVSLGAQSLNNDKLKFLGRQHTNEDIYQAINNLRKNNLHNINLDLIFGTQNESLSDLRADLDNYLKINSTHISCYELTIEEGTPFYKAQETGKLNLPKEKNIIDSFYLISETLVKNGYQHYEISNYCKPNFESQHNYRTWQFEDYLGVGVGAHSAFNILQPIQEILNATKQLPEHQQIPYRLHWANIASPNYYKEKLTLLDNIAWQEVLSEEKTKNEYLLLSLRTKNGLNLKKYLEYFGQDLLVSASSIITKLLDLKLIEVSNENLKITEQGKILADYITEQLVNS